MSGCFLFFIFSKTEWWEPCSSTLWKERFLSPLKATPPASPSLRSRETQKSQLCSVSLLEDRLEERWSILLTQAIICLFLFCWWGKEINQPACNLFSCLLWLSCTSLRWELHRLVISRFQRRQWMSSFLLKHRMTFQWPCRYVSFSTPNVYIFIKLWFQHSVNV